LLPFLRNGSTAALLPIATANELVAQLTILSLDPATPISEETLETARSIAQQAALAIDNARLYQQQKQFAETMQQSLLPRERPAIPGLEVGTVYESAAQVDVGGDVFDFMELPDRRLAVVLGDVTGHGIDATADMAMAKFVFRSLAREHSEPSDFLAHANEVVVGEIAVGKFITMAYLTVDPGGEVLCVPCLRGGRPDRRRRDRRHQTARNRRVNLRRAGGLPLVIGHRGAAAVAPENTLAGLEAAVAAQVDLVEFDISPGLRLGHSLDELPADEISLDDALEFLKAHSVGVHLDVKLPGYEEQVLAAVRRHAIGERAVLSTAF